MADFLAMGGYGAFVWSAYGLVALAMVALAVSSLRRLRRLEARLAALPARRRARPAAGLPETETPS